MVIKTSFSNNYINLCLVNSIATIVTYASKTMSMCIVVISGNIVRTAHTLKQFKTRIKVRKGNLFHGLGTPNFLGCQKSGQGKGNNWTS